MYAQAKALAERLTEGGVRAYTDPAMAAANRPCVLIPPPQINFSTRGATWTLVGLTDQEFGSEAAWSETDSLVAKVNEVLPVESARPGSYYLTPAVGAVPAYLMQFTTSH